MCCRTDCEPQLIDDKLANICLNTMKKNFSMQTEQLKSAVIDAGYGVDASNTTQKAQGKGCCG